MIYKRYYGGVGSRKTPLNITMAMSYLGIRLGSLGYTLRSGHAMGADLAFEEGVDFIKSTKEIFTVNSGTILQREQWRNVARSHHPSWQSCSEYARKLHTRNSPIVLGQNLNTPIEFLICWTPNGEVKGGTGQTIRVASSFGVPIFNLALDEHINSLHRWLR